MSAPITDEDRTSAHGIADEWEFCDWNAAPHGGACTAIAQLLADSLASLRERLASVTAFHLAARQRVDELATEVLDAEARNATVRAETFREALTLAREAVAEERLVDPNLDCEGDKAYGEAVLDCLAAIGRIPGAPPVAAQSPAPPPGDVAVLRAERDEAVRLLVKFAWLSPRGREGALDEAIDQAGVFLGVPFVHGWPDRATLSRMAANNRPRTEIPPEPGDDDDSAPAATPAAAPTEPTKEPT